MSLQPATDDFSSMTLYDPQTGPYPARVRIALAELNLGDRIKSVYVDLPAGDHKTPAFKAMNYSCKVPVLQLQDGTCITECIAITQLLDGLSTGGQLTGKTLKEQAVVHMMTRRVENEVMGPINAYFHTATPGLGPIVEDYQNKEHGMHELERARLGLRHFNDILAYKEYVAADFFSMADICLIGALLLFSMVSQDIPKDCVHVLSWYERVQKRASVRDVKQVFDDAMIQRRAQTSHTE